MLNMKLKRAGAIVIVSSLFLMCGVVSIDAANASKTYSISKHAKLYGNCNGNKDSILVHGTISGSKGGADKAGVIAQVEGGICSPVYADKDIIKKFELNASRYSGQYSSSFLNIFGETRYAYTKVCYKEKEVIRIKAKCN